ELWEVLPEIVSCEEAQGKKPITDAEQQKAHPGVMTACDAVVNKDAKLLASYEAEPIVLAEDSESADVTAELVDVGEGTYESDYAGKDVKGRIVLASAQPGAVQDLAVGKFGAAGVVSYAQNQKTAWWGEDRSEEHTSELQSLAYLVCRLLLEKKKAHPPRRRWTDLQRRPRRDPRQ